MAKKNASGGVASGLRPDADVERRREMAEAGDVAGILELLGTMRADADRANDILKELGMAIGVRAGMDPEGFSRDVYARMVAMTAHLLFRSQFFVDRRIQAYSRAPWGMGRPDLPSDIEAALARLRDLQGHVGELLQGQAAVARMWELTRAKRLENDGAGDQAVTRSRGRKDRRPTEARKKPTPHVNGHQGNRISDLLDGLVIGSDGAEHDG